VRDRVRDHRLRDDELADEIDQAVDLRDRDADARARRRGRALAVGLAHRDGDGGRQHDFDAELVGHGE
jgi:hypothetical protein